MLVRCMHCTFIGIEYINKLTLYFPVTMKITGGSFRGFIIQARKRNGRLAQGKMQGPPPLTQPICGTTGVSETNAHAAVLDEIA